MSLPLRHSFENLDSLDRALEDLLVRFIINVPPEDLSSVERELFHFEEASWFYTDFVKLLNPSLPSLRIKSFATNIIRLCPIVWKWDIKADEALQKFSQYKKSIPVRGAAIFNTKLNKILLVKGIESDSWSFPRGKISKDEDDVQCCIREVKEEIGFDLTDYIDENQFIERYISGKNYKIFLVGGVSEDIDFKPQVRNEIEKIEWKDFKKITKSSFKSSSSTRYYLINSMIRPLSIWCKRQKPSKVDDAELKRYAEQKLKNLLGISNHDNELNSNKSELNDQASNTYVDNSDNTVNISSSVGNNGNNDLVDLDPGRALLNSIQNAFHSNNSQQFLPNVATPQYNASVGMMFPNMNQNVQPFAPFPFVNNMEGAPVGQNGLPSNNVPLSHPPPFFNNQMSPMNNAVGNVEQLTPNITSLSKPSLAQTSSSNDAKQLLSILKDGTPESNTRKIDIDVKDAPSKNLLTLLKNTETTNNDQFNFNEQLNDFKSHDFDHSGKETYEEFESSSEEEELQELKNLDKEELPAVGTLENKILQASAFQNTNKDIPHIDALHDSTVCDIPSVKHSDSAVKLNPEYKIESKTARTPESGNKIAENKPSTSKPKQKIKLLKRGETLQFDIVPPKVSSASLPYSEIDQRKMSETSHDFLDAIKQPVLSPKSSVFTSDVPKTSNPLLEVLRRPSTIDDSLSMSNKEEINVKQPSNPSNPLLDILRKPSVSRENGERTMSPDSSNSLISLLRNSTSEASQEYQSRESLLPINQFPPQHNIHTNANELLQVLSQPSYQNHMPMQNGPSNMDIPMGQPNMSMTASVSPGSQSLGHFDAPPGIPPPHPQHMNMNPNHQNFDEFLNMMNGSTPSPMNSQLNAPMQTSYAMGTPEVQSQNNQSASNQLLNILHRR